MLLVRAPTARIGGRMRYSFLDENDQPTFAHDQYGREIRGGFWSPNLVTNGGLNAVATQRLRWYPGAISNDPQEWRAWMRVGTGSTAPAFSNSALANEVFDEEPGDMATNSDGGFADVNSYPSASGGFISAHFRITRVFTLDQARNLTEYGFSTTAAGNLNVRELFRDGNGNPITISIAAGKKLRVDHTLTYSLPWGVSSEPFDIEEYDVSNALVATHSFTSDCVWVAVHRSKMFYFALPIQMGGETSKRFDVYTSAPSTDPLTEVSGTGNRAVTTDGYVANSHQVRVSCVIPEASLNVEMHGFVFRTLGQIGSNEARQQGFRVAFVAPATFTKADTHTLEFAVILSWARA